MRKRRDAFQDLPMRMDPQFPHISGWILRGGLGLNLIALHWLRNLKIVLDCTLRCTLLWNDCIGGCWSIIDCGMMACGPALARRGERKGRGGVVPLSSSSQPPFNILDPFFLSSLPSIIGGCPYCCNQHVTRLNQDQLHSVIKVIWGEKQKHLWHDFSNRVGKSTISSAIDLTVL